jgi:hypothetical protein
VAGGETSSSSATDERGGWDTMTAGLGSAPVLGLTSWPGWPCPAPGAGVRGCRRAPNR